MRVLGWVVVVVAALMAVVMLDPASFGWPTANGGAQAIGARPWLMVGFAVLAVVAGLVVRAGRRRGRAQMRVAALAAVFALVAAGHASVLLSRGVVPGVAPEASSETANQLTVVSLNVHGGFRGADRLVELIDRTGADVVALPETAAWFREALVARLAQAGQHFQVFDGAATGSPGYGSVLLVSDALGPYREVATTTPGTVRVESISGVGPPFAVVHPTSPKFDLTASERRMDRWRSELAAARDLAADMPGGVIAGDFNATFDHGPLRSLPGYLDAATTAGRGGVGTFPSTLPTWLSSAIDHVLADSSAFGVADVAIVDVAGTDHRAVIARLDILL